MGWGYLGGIYSDGTGIVTFPGMSILLAPVAMASSHFHMSESFAQFVVAKPSAALILQPVELALTSSVIVASDSLAEQLNVSARRRRYLCIAVAIIAWPVAAVWGHAEDVLVVTLSMYGLVAFLNRKWATMGWLLGFGIVIQPLVALLVPLLIGATPHGQRLLLAFRSTAISTVLVVVAFAGNPTDTFRSLVKQPTPPSINHATPWVALAPTINSAAIKATHSAALVKGTGHHAINAMASTGGDVITVAGGPGRMIDVFLALLLGLVVWRKPQPPVRVLWLAAAVLVSRCLFEAVMTPYYLAPPILLCLVLASCQRGKRFWTAFALSVELTVFAYHHLNPWVWWLPIATGIVGILALGYPHDVKTGTSSPDEAADLGDVLASRRLPQTSADGIRGRRPVLL